MKELALRLSGIQKLEELDKIVNLSTLDVAQNEIKAQENIGRRM